MLLVISGSMKQNTASPVITHPQPQEDVQQSSLSEEYSQTSHHPVSLKDISPHEYDDDDDTSDILSVEEAANVAIEQQKRAKRATGDDKQRTNVCRPCQGSRKCFVLLLSIIIHF